jgi:uncharacterized hydantoinase/oxoprolinase family protein
MLLADHETVAKDRINSLANDVLNRQKMLIETAVDRAWSPIQTALFDQQRDPQEERRSAIVAGSGEFLITSLKMLTHCDELISLSDQLGPAVSACAPAYAVAMLAAES